MKISGWFLMMASWGIIAGMLAFCFFRIFFKKNDEQGDDDNGNQN